MTNNEGAGPLLEFNHLFQAALACGLAVLGWLRVIEREEIKAMKAQIAAALARAEDAEDALAAHKLFASENFARTADMKASMAEMEARLIREMDQRSAREIALLEEIRANTRRAQ